MAQELLKCIIESNRIIHSLSRTLKIDLSTPKESTINAFLTLLGANFLWETLYTLNLKDVRPMNEFWQVLEKLLRRICIRKS